MSHHNQQPVARKAEFSERALAFTADYALFAVAWFIVLKAIDPGLPVLLNEKGTIVTIAAVTLFIVYQAFFSCEGRASLGKHLLGLRVANGHGEPLDLGRAVMRALGYIPSSFLTLGFFWALVDPNRHAWHDFVAGSDVVSDHALRGGRRTAFGLAGGVLVIAFALAAGWQGIWEPRYLKIMTVAHAQAGLTEVERLQATYHQRNGRYAGSLFALAEVSSDPRGFLRDMAVLYDLKMFRFKADREGWAVATRARDVDQTLVAVSGP